jgi:hypothetical protein
MKPLDHVEVAVRLVQNGTAERIDGDGWKVYRAGAIIRIDLAADFNLDDGPTS